MSNIIYTMLHPIQYKSWCFSDCHLACHFPHHLYWKWWLYLTPVSTNITSLTPELSSPSKSIPKARFTLETSAGNQCSPAGYLHRVQNAAGISVKLSIAQRQVTNTVHLPAPDRMIQKYHWIRFQCVSKSNTCIWCDLSPFKTNGLNMHHIKSHVNCTGMHSMFLCES